jgi:hypothetical protein
MGVTVTVADLVTDPPAPMQVKSYVVVVLRVPVDSEPEVGLVPLQPPEEVQADASVELQVNVLDWPAIISARVALNDKAGAGGGILVP